MKKMMNVKNLKNVKLNYDEKFKIHLTQLPKTKMLLK